jgi:transcriptional regulator with XRE-family HTH domain
MAEIIDNVKVGQFIKGLLKEKHMTQDQLAETLHITKAAVSQNLNGKSAFDIQNLVKIAELFHLSLDDLIAGRKPKDLIDIDSEYVRMMKRGLKDFQAYDPSQLNIAHPDVYGRVLMDYLLAEEADPWITYMVEKKIPFALPEHVRYRPLVQRVVLYVLQKQLTSPLPLIQAYVVHFGMFDFTEDADRQLFFALLNRKEGVPLLASLWHEKETTTVQRSIFFIPFQTKVSTYWMNRDLILRHVMEFHLVHLWTWLVKNALIQRAFYQLEPILKRLVQFGFIDGLVILVQSMPSYDRNETFLSYDVMDAMVFLAQKKHVQVMVDAIQKNLVFDLQSLWNRLIPLGDDDLLTQLMDAYPQKISPKKSIKALIENQRFGFIETHVTWFGNDVLSYGLDAISLDKADAKTLHHLIDLGAKFKAEYANRFTAEKMNRLLTKPKKGN